MKFVKEFIAMAVFVISMQSAIAIGIIYAINNINWDWLQ
jgi:hypothetical protein